MTPTVLQERVDAARLEVHRLRRRQSVLRIRHGGLVLAYITVLIPSVLLGGPILLENGIAIPLTAWIGITGYRGSRRIGAAERTRERLTDEQRRGVAEFKRVRVEQPERGQCPVCGLADLDERAVGDRVLDDSGTAYARVVPYLGRRAHAECAAVVPWAPPHRSSEQELDLPVRVPAGALRASLGGVKNRLGRAPAEAATVLEEAARRADRAKEVLADIPRDRRELQVVEHLLGRHLQPTAHCSRCRDHAQDPQWRVHQSPGEHDHWLGRHIAFVPNCPICLFARRSGVPRR